MAKITLTTLNEKLDLLRVDFEEHATSKVRHFGTVIATMWPPIFMGIVELLKYLLK